VPDPERPEPDPVSDARRRRTRRAVLAGAGGLALVGAAAWWFFLREESSSLRGLSDYEFYDRVKVYFGNQNLSQRPAVVDSSRVFAQIPEYQQILREGLRDDVPKYHLLMVKASDRFKKAVSVAARQANRDAVAEVGTVHPRLPTAPEPPDLTDATIAAIE
jgi:hypothetical protein